MESLPGQDLNFSGQSSLTVQYEPCFFVVSLSNILYKDKLCLMEFCKKQTFKTCIIALSVTHLDHALIAHNPSHVGHFKENSLYS